jgi:hypothetical protein
VHWLIPFLLAALLPSRFTGGLLVVYMCILMLLGFFE